MNPTPTASEDPPAGMRRPQAIALMLCSMASFRILVAASILAVLTVPASADASQRGQGRRSRPKPWCRRRTHPPPSGPQRPRPGATGAPRPATGKDQRMSRAQPAWLAGLHRQHRRLGHVRLPAGREQPGRSGRAATATAQSHWPRWRWPTSASMSEDWDLLCTTMIHETGPPARPAPRHPARQHDGARCFDDELHGLPSICRTMRPRAAR